MFPCSATQSRLVPAGMRTTDGGRFLTRAPNLPIEESAALQLRAQRRSLTGFPFDRPRRSGICRAMQGRARLCLFVGGTLVERLR